MQNEKTPGYTYVSDAAADVPGKVKAGAGVGMIK
jgi:hypothetical protein